ncbi:class I SAM-dependent methyltransferase [bacterium]|nr:class I SAM-dependent methyltransferase [bacterium]
MTAQEGPAQPPRPGSAQHTEIGQVQPLSYADYDRLFYGAFVPNSAEYRDANNHEGPMIYRVAQLLRDSQPRSVLSIGAGSGENDIEVLQASGINLDCYVAIEPNDQHRATLAKNWEGRTPGDFQILDENFSEAFGLDSLGGRKFDMVLMPHSLYFVKDPAATIAHALSCTTDDGQVIVAHQTHNTGVCAFFRTISDRYGVRWNPEISRQDHAMSTTTIGDALTQAGISHNVVVDPACVYVDAFDDPAKRQERLDLMSFFMNTVVDHWPAEVLRDMESEILRNSRRMSNSGRREFEHPQGFIIARGQ